MNLDLLNITSKEVTRNAFDEFKRQIDVRLFPFYDDLKDNLQKQMLEQLGMSVIKTMYKSNVSEKQLEVITYEMNNFKLLASKTSINYTRNNLK